MLRRVSRHWFVHKKLNVKIPGVGVVQLTLFRLVWRTLYVSFTTGSVCMHMLCHLMLGDPWEVRAISDSSVMWYMYTDVQCHALFVSVCKVMA